MSKSIGINTMTYQASACTLNIEFPALSPLDLGRMGNEWNNVTSNLSVGLRSFHARSVNLKDIFERGVPENTMTALALYEVGTSSGAVVAYLGLEAWTDLSQVLEALAVAIASEVRPGRQVIVRMLALEAKRAGEWAARVCTGTMRKAVLDSFGMTVETPMVPLQSAPKWPVVSAGVQDMRDPEQSLIDRLAEKLEDWA